MLVVVQVQESFITGVRVSIEFLIVQSTFTHWRDWLAFKLSSGEYYNCNVHEYRSIKRDNLRHLATIPVSRTLYPLIHTKIRLRLQNLFQRGQPNDSVTDIGPLASSARRSDSWRLESIFVDRCRLRESRVRDIMTSQLFNYQSFSQMISWDRTDHAPDVNHNRVQPI